MTADGELLEKVAEHGVEINNLKESDRDLWKAIKDSHKELGDAIKQIRNRLPHWATLLIAILMGVIGFLAKGGID